MAPITDGENNSDGGDTSLARNRSKRVKVDKTGRLAALERLKKVKEKGERNKYEVVEENVYEEVEEKEYSNIVRKRQEDDWIVDDDGSGYVEDGREIFDDDRDDDPEETGSRKDGSKRKSKNPNIRAPDSKPKGIKSMFAAAAVKTKKKPERDVSIKDDNILGDIMAELSQSPSATFMPPPIKLKKKPAYNPFSAKVTPKKPAVIKPLTPRNVSNEMAPVQPPVPAPKGRKVVKKIARSVEEKMDELDSGMIEDFNSQEETFAHPSQDIQEPSSQQEQSSIDISDINFDDDDMDQSEAKADTGSSGSKTAPDIVIPDTPSTSWETVKGDVADLPTDIVVDSSKLPLITNDEGEQVLRMYWLDAYEDYYRQPGIVYLFGKVWIESAKAHVSCCVSVRNIEKRIFLLPRKTRRKCGGDTGEPVTFIDVYQEFNNFIAEKHKIMKFKSMKVVKDYAFELVEVPAQSEYLEVRFSAEYPQLPKDLTGETFSHVFGTNTSSLEIFLLDRRMKGPCWIDIKMPQIPNPPISWCKVEAFVNKPEYVNVNTATIPPPALVVMTMNLRTVPNPKTHQNEIIAASCLTHHQFHMDKPPPKPHFQQHICTITKPNDCVFPFDFKDRVTKQNNSMKVEIMGSERALLGYLLAKIHKVDPDIIVGHDIFGFDIDVLLHRIHHNKIPHWSRLGRLKRATMPKLSGSFGAKNSMSANATSGRLVCDVKISAKELIRSRSYDLTELVSQLLKEKRHEVDTDQIKAIYNNSAHLMQFIEWTLVDSSYILRMMYELNVIPLALQITNICGNVLARTLMGGRAERNEFLLLHAFTEKNFIVPDKSFGKAAATPAVLDDDLDQTAAPSGKKAGRRKPAYAGGLVLEPKKGFYDKYILLLDFNSLYPSIIQEYNICFTTIARDATVSQAQAESELSIELPDSSLDPGILPTEIRKLVQSRRQVKQLMKTPDLSPDMYQQYDIRQKALKLTANSMYGCLGFTFSRFYAKPLAALVTGKGREILLKTKDLVESMNLDVIYGDTDSIMVNTNSTDMEQVFKLGNKVKNEVNKLYKLLEIDIDGVFKSMLLLKKKKYAALTVTKVGDQYHESQELKGLDIVRRDWCELAKEAGNFIVGQILSGLPRETILENIHGRLVDVGQQVKDGKVPTEVYHITKSLTKNPEDYPDKKSLPHVQVALRLNSKGGKKMRGGDTVYYIICEDGTSLPASQRAYHPDELAKRDDLKIDIKYYLASQVHPVVSRLCDPIDGTDAAQIAECLGLDPSGYQQALRQTENDEDEAMLGSAQISDEEKYKDCDRFKFHCPGCSREIIIDSVFDGAGDMIVCRLASCPNVQCNASPAEALGILKNRLTLVIRAHVKKYYEGWMKCEDHACSARTRRISLMFNRGHPICQACNRGALQVEYTDSALYHQLCFYQYIFDIDKAISAIKGTKDRLKASNVVPGYRPAYSILRSHVDRWIKQSAYSNVNLTKLFQGLFSLK